MFFDDVVFRVVEKIVRAFMDEAVAIVFVYFQKFLNEVFGVEVNAGTLVVYCVR